MSSPPVSTIFGSNCLSVSPGAIGKNPVQLLWQTKVCDDIAVKTILVGLHDLVHDLVYVQTNDHVVALDRRNGQIRWTAPCPNASAIVETSEKQLLSLTDNGKTLILIDSQHGQVIKSITVSAQCNTTPITHASGNIFVQGAGCDQGFVLVYDSLLQLCCKLPISHAPIDNVFITGCSLVVLCQKNLYSIALNNLKVEEVHELAVVPHLVTKVSDDTLFCALKDTQYLYHVPTKQFTQLSLSGQLVGYPILMGQAGIVYQQAPMNQNFTSLHQFHRATISGQIQWSIKDTSEPQCILVDKDQTVIIAFSPSNQAHQLSSSYQMAPTCYIKAFDGATSQELFTYISKTPIHRPITIGPQGELYFFSAGCLHVLVGHLPCK